jgi:serine/threonine protein kinase/tetratricopeptide (TPR) repeat protein
VTDPSSAQPGGASPEGGPGAARKIGGGQEVRREAAAELSHLPVDLSELPAEVLTRLEERSRALDRRLMVGRYLITGELGRGGMGVVYEAWDPRIERTVAIKTIEPELVGEEDREEVIERFRRETKVVGRLHHPGIVTIYDYGEERERPGAPPILYYYVMEYLVGHSLARVLRERHTLPDTEAVAITADISDALQVSHNAGIIHRDIKPSNIFLRDDKQAVLLDFGIAKTASVALTRQGQILGTPSYLAPERLREKEIGVDGRADIFSLGVLLFTMLTGDAPFVGDDVYDVIDKIAKESHPKLARTTPSGQALSRVLDRMLAKSPSDRYPTAGDAANALRDVLNLLKQTNPEIEDLLGGGVRIREPIPEGTATEIAVPSGMAKAADEEDTGRQPIHVPAPPSFVAMRTVADMPIGDDGSGGDIQDEDGGTLDEAQDLQQKTAADIPRPMDLIGTVPELPLQRDTREIDRESPSSASDDTADQRVPDPVPRGQLLLETKEISDSEAEAYQPHGLSNDETTDDSTIAEGEARRRRMESFARHPLAAQVSPALAKSAAPIARPISGRQVFEKNKGAITPSGTPALKNPSQPNPVVSLKHPSYPPPPPPGTKSPALATPLAGTGGMRPPPLPPPPPPLGDRGEVVRASSLEHSEAKTENDPTPRPSLRPGKSPPSRSQAGSKRSRIEASLVDEDDVVVKPAPLDALKPDELPTQTSFKLPGQHPSGSHAPVSPLPASQTLNDDVVRVRGDSRVQDPAEARRTSGIHEEPRDETEGGVMVEDTDDERAEPELEVDDSGEAPRSAAVARRTFAARSQGARAGRAAGVHVKISGGGSLNADRIRIVRRRGFMLLAAMLAAIAIGLMLGRMKQRSAAGDSQGGDLHPTVVSPRVSQTGRDERGELQLVRPRALAELLQEAGAALTEGKIARAERLYESAVRIAPEKSRIKAQALVGRADALRQLGKKDESIELYRSVLAEVPKTPEADEARIALMELGVGGLDVAAPAARGASRSGDKPKRSDAKEPQDKKPDKPDKQEKSLAGTVSPDVPTEITADMTSEEKCHVIVRKHISDPRETVRALADLGRQDPKASCVYWYLGNKYMMLGDDRAALESYRRYLELRPDAPKRPAVEERIKNLAAKLGPR